jgi:hypothetical protein
MPKPSTPNRASQCNADVECCYERIRGRYTMPPAVGGRCDVFPISRSGYRRSNGLFRHLFGRMLVMRREAFRYFDDVVRCW